MRSVIFCLVASAVFPSLSRAQTPAEAPVFEITHAESTMKFDVESSVAIVGVRQVGRDFDLHFA
jgi:hypothetical protein